MTDVSTACTTTVRVRELPLLADVGINPDEVGRRQPLVISVKLTLFGGGDRIDETIDYRRIASAAATLATTHIPLIDTFARSLGAEYLAWPAVQRSEERRVGNEWVSTCRFRWSPYH